VEQKRNEKKIGTGIRSRVKWSEKDKINMLEIWQGGAKKKIRVVKYRF